MKCYVFLFPGLLGDLTAGPYFQDGFAVLFRPHDLADLADKVEALVLSPVVDLNFFGHRFFSDEVL
jgi:hypothetical protein